jgi:malonate transporter
MAFFATIANALVPIVFVMLLGLIAGWTKLLQPKDSAVLATIALDFCLPSLLFGATASVPMAALRDWRFFLGIALGLLIVFAIALAAALLIFRKPIAESSLQALNSSLPNMAFIGLPVLTAVIGKSALLSVAVGNLISSLVLLPLALTLLAAGGTLGAGIGRALAVRNAVLGAVKQPLVWAPLAGIVLVFAQLPLPGVVLQSCSLIGEATSGVALFALGLLLSGQKLHVDLASSVNVASKMLAQPAVMFVLAVLLGVTGLHRREMILLGALPTATLTPMFAVAYKVYVIESEATVLLSTGLFVVTLSAVIALTA